MAGMLNMFFRIQQQLCILDGIRQNEQIKSGRNYLSQISSLDRIQLLSPAVTDTDNSPERKAESRQHETLRESLVFLHTPTKPSFVSSQQAA